MTIAKFLFCLIAVCVTCGTSQITARRPNSESSQESSCIGCQKEILDTRSQYHLQKIKQKIQSALGIDEMSLLDNPGISPSALPSPIELGDLGVFGEMVEERPKSHVERQVILSEMPGLVRKNSRRQELKFNISSAVFRSVKKLTMADVWLPQHLIRPRYFLTMSLQSHGVTSRRKVQVLNNQSMEITQREKGWVSLSLKKTFTSFIRGDGTGFSDRSDIWTVLTLFDKRPLEENNTIKDKSSTFRPFLVLETAERAQSRQRRGVDCIAGQGTRCCRAKLTVRFADIGLGDHVIEPREFEAYQCVGNCGSFSTNLSPRVEIMKSVLSNLRQKNLKTDHISFCCTAERYSSQKLIYYSSDKTKIFAKSIPGLVVESCDCL